MIKPSVSGDIIGLLPIIPMESKSKGNEKGRVYCVHGTLKLFKTEFEVSFSFSQHGSYTLEKGGG